MFTGSMVALVTPFNNGQVDYDRLADLVEFHIESGTNCLVPCGTTGESPTLSTSEHKGVIKFVAEKAAGRIPVIAGTGSNCTEEAIELTAYAKEVGVDATLQVTPYYNKPSQEGMYQHFMAIANAVDLPIILYNIPGRCVVNMEPDTIIRLAQHKNIVGIKEATGKMDQASSISVSGCDLVILSGDDSLTLPLASVGGQGVISVVANIVPVDVRKMTDAIAAGDFVEARKWHDKLYKLGSALLGLSTNPVPIKAAMAMLGMCSEELRLPMIPLDDAARVKLTTVLKDYGLL